MASEKDQLPPIEPLHDRWEPNPDPSTIDVPGLDTTAPVQDQIEQMEQLITIKLQNIDANFARAHQILSTKILPAVKRFAVNTEPVRESARFWVSFYEQAAQVRIPTSDDFSADLEQQSTRSEEEIEVEQPPERPTQAHTFDPNVTPSESSFAPEGLVSSTPMNHSMGQSRRQVEEKTTPSWSASLVSPLERLDKGLKSLGEGDDSIIDDSGQSSGPFNQSVQQKVHLPRPPVLSAQEKGKSKAPPETLLQNVLSKNLKNAGRDASDTSPRKAKVKTPKRNPRPTPRGAPSASDSGWNSDEDNFLPRNMSPPASAFVNRIMRTPGKEAAARIGRDLVGDAARLRQRFGAVAEPSLTTSPSTPSLSIYSKRAMGMENSEQSTEPSVSPTPNASVYSKRVLGVERREQSTEPVVSPPVDVIPSASTSTEHSVESMMHRFGLDSSKYGGDSAQGGRGVQGAEYDSFDDSFDDRRTGVDDDDRGGDGDSSDEFYEEANTGAPSAAFLMASQRQRRESDDSFGGSDDSLDEELGGGRAIHPFANVFSQAPDDDGFDDSFDDDEDVQGGNGEDEATVVPGGTASRGSDGQLRLLGQDLLDDTTALNNRLRSNVVPDTPTPWAGSVNPESF
ncbi:DASH complex subunit Ask1-domain-containing protein [Phellopilus nigrolimitatus]|nr:DASH complex subunit Ask1-domain-containing protein [Phellopilus nigrolimitatus]